MAVQVSGDYVGTLTNRIIFDAENSSDVFDGYHVGDIVAFIGETTPAPTGDRGIGAWSTLYIPAGVRVVGAELVRPDGDGTYSAIPAKDVAAAHNDCGNRGCAFPTTGTYQNGGVNEVQQDTGVFYSGDGQTALLGTPLTVNPTGVAAQNVYNTWDYNQVRAFGQGGAFSGNGGQGNTPVVQIGGTWFGTGSPVAGSGTYYQKDYDPTCDPGTGTTGAAFQADLGCTGPWQRIAHPGSKIGGSGAIVPSTTGAAAPLVNTAVPTATGYDFVASGALPATTNSLRYVQGIRRIGDLETVRIYFQITNPAAFTASFSNNSFCLDGTGGDLDKGDITDPGRRGAQDNPWRYYEGNTHQCYFGSANGILLKGAEFVNGVPSSGVALAQNDIVGYAVTFYNTTAATLFDIDFSDARIANLDLVAAGTAGCPYANYNGNRAGLPTLNTLSATTATWNLGSNSPGTSGAFTPAAVTVTGHPANQGTFIDEDNPDANDGANAKINLKTDSGKRTRGLVDWNLAGLGIPAGSTVTSAQLSFYVTDSKPTTATVHRLKRSWVEGTGNNAVGADWESPDDNGNPPTNTWTAPGGDGDFTATALGSFSLATKNVRLPVPATALVQGWVNTPATNFGVILLASGPNDEAKIGSDDHAEPPRLSLTYLPPGSTTTSLAAAGTLVGGGEAITLTLTVRANASDALVTPPAPTVTGANGASATCGGAWTPASQALSTTAGTFGQITFTRVCTATFSSLGTFDVMASARDVVSRGGTVGDRVWLDVDGDGVQDIGEPGIGNVEVTLYDAGLNGVPGGGDDVAIATTRTGADGQYFFTHLQPGTYFVDVTNATVPTGLTLSPGSTDPSSTVTVTAEEIFLDLDFGYRNADPANAVIGDQVWSDDGDGVLEPGEVGIGGVLVELIGAGPDGILGTPDDVVVQTKTTAADGSYLFTGVAAGSYRVRVNQAGSPSLAGYTFQSGPQSLGNPTPPITVAGRDAELGADFAYVNPAAFPISDRLWLDVDGDGVQDPGEVGIPGVTITVDGPSLGSPISVVTDAAGRWPVPGLAPGNYTIDYDPTTLPAGFSPIPTNTGGEPTYNVTLAAGNIFLHLDYGFTGGPTGSIGDLVYFDGNGTFGGGDCGVADVTVDLIDHTTNQVIATTTTGPGGSYDFTDLAAGTYRVRVTDVGGVLAGLNPTQTAPSPISLANGQDYNLADFGYAPSGGVGSIGSVLWHDENGNGLRGAGEDGIQGVTVDLWRDVNQDGIITPGIDNLLRSVATDENGEYEFAGLRFDRYLVTVTDRAGVLGGFTKTPGPVPGTNDNSQADPYAVLLNSGSPTNITADFGWQAGGTPHRILGPVFEDDNPQDGLYDSINEFGVKDVELLLYRIVGGQQYLIGRTTAAVDGSYSFDNLPDGQYRVAAVTRGSLVDGFVQTTQTGTGGTQPVTLAGADSPGNDFGFFNGGVTTTPVTLAHFSSESLGGIVRITWITATEVGNVAFNLHAFGEQGWRLLNEEPIPSRVVDSIEPQQYQLEAAVEAGESFLLEDLDVLGRSRFHGPFEVDRSYGEADLGHEAIDWQAVRSEHQQSEHQRSEQARSQAAAELQSFSPFAKQGATGPTSVYLRVARDGVYRVSYEALAAAGLDLTKVQANKLELSAQGQPVPLRVISRGSFGSGDAVEFVGQALDTLYTRTQVYTLTVDGQGGGKGKGKTRIEADKGKIANGAVAPDFYLEELRLETDRSYSPLAPGEDPWFDAFIFTFGSRASTSITAQLAGWQPGAAPVTVAVELWGGTAMPKDPDHHVIFQVNGEPVADEFFDGQVERTLGGEVPDWVLAPSNQLEVVLPGAYEAQFRGTAEAATYWVVSAEQLLAPEISLVPAAIDPAGGSAELLVISHPDFVPGLERLVDHRRAQGWGVQVVDTEALYSQFGHGVFGPQAIRGYVAHAAEELGTTHVLLVGGDTYDYHNALGQGSMSFVPSLYTATGELVRHAPADSLYTDLDGDQVPDLAIGRFPVRTSAELEAMIDKTLAYEATAAAPRAVVAADGYDVGAGFSFALASEQLAALIPQSWGLEEIYVDELGVAQARADLLAETLTEARSERILGRQIYQRAFVPGATLGQVLRDAKRQIAGADAQAARDVVLGWTLLGDPTLSLVPVGFHTVDSQP